MEVDPAEAAAEFAAFAKLFDGGSEGGSGGADDGAEVNPLAAFLGGAAGGALGDLRLGELLETPPPGVDEIMAISKVRAARRPCTPAGRWTGAGRGALRRHHIGFGAVQMRPDTPFN